MQSKRADSPARGQTLTTPYQPAALLGTVKSVFGLSGNSREDGTVGTSKKSASALAWLDGYRGLAAIGVFNFHYFTAYTDSIATGYGSDANHKSITQLPFIRLLADGGTFVNVFFVVSGYVCSLSALKAMTNHDTDQALRSISSSLFRRFFRLYLPVFAVTLISALGAQLGVYDLIRPMIDQKQTYFPGVFSEVNLPRSPSLWQQLSFWVVEMTKLANPWAAGPFYPLHDPHLWTIRYEFRMSLALYLSLVMLVKCRPKVRMVLLFVLGMLQFMCNLWEGPVFFTGAALAQYDIIRAQEQQRGSHQSSSSSSGRSFSYTRMVRILGYVMAFWFMTFPIGGHKRLAPGYIWMLNLIPAWYNRKEKLPKTIGVLLLTFLLCTDTPSQPPQPPHQHHSSSSSALLPSSPSSSLLPSSSPSTSTSTSTISTSTPTSNEPALLHRIFQSTPAQVAGQYMFGLYLVHGPILHAFGYAIPHVVWSVTGNSNALTHTLGLLIGWAVNLSVCVVCAVLFHRYIEPMCGKATKRIEGWCVVAT